MFYLLHCNKNNLDNLSIIIGIAKNKKGVFELLFTYYKLLYSLFFDLTYEILNDDLQLCGISYENYDYLKEQIEKNNDKIEENYKNMEYYPENNNAICIFVTLEDNQPKYHIFDKEFHIRYNEILKNSTQILM